jgi:hypothetical protein
VRPSLSQSAAHTLVSKSPRHAWLEHPRLGGKRRKATRSMDRGSIVGAILLGTADEVLCRVPEFRNYKTDAARAARDKATSEGLVPVLDHEFGELHDAALHVRKRMTELGIVLSGESEVAIEWTESSTAGDVVCRGRLDHLIESEGVIYDLKSIVSAHPDKCQKHMDDYGYDIQWAAYTSAVTKLHPELLGRTRMGFVFFEIEPPYEVTPIRPDGTLRELGALRWERAVNTWARCLRDDRWPGYATDWIDMSARPWVLANEQSRIC